MKLQYPNPLGRGSKFSSTRPIFLITNVGSTEKNTRSAARGSVLTRVILGSIDIKQSNPPEDRDQAQQNDRETDENRVHETR